MQIESKGRTLSKVKPRAVSRPSTESLISRGLVRNANNRIQFGSKPAPLQNSQRKTYQLYSSESDTDRVGSLNSGLDRCASLLANILEEDDKGLEKTKSTVKTKPTMKRKKPSVKIQAGGRKKSCLKKTEVPISKFTNKRQDLTTAQRKHKTKIVIRSPEFKSQGKVFSPVETQVQKDFLHEKLPYGQIPQAASSPIKDLQMQNNNYPITPMPETIADSTLNDNGTIIEQPARLSPPYQDLEDALLRITSKLNAPLSTKRNLGSRIEDTSTSDSNSTYRGMWALNAKRPISRNTEDSPKSSLRNRYLPESSGDEEVESLTNCSGNVLHKETEKLGESTHVDTFCLAAVEQNNKPSPGGVPSTLETPSDKYVNMDIKGSVNVSNATAMDSSHLSAVLGAELKDVDILHGASTKDTLAPDRNSSASKRLMTNDKRYYPSTSSMPSMELSDSMAASHLNDKEPLSSPLVCKDVGLDWDWRQNLSEFLHKLRKHKTVAATEDLSTVIEVLEACFDSRRVKQIVGCEAEVQVVNEELKNFKTENRELKRILASMQTKCQEYDKMTEVYEKALKTALEAKKDQVQQRNEQLLLEKNFHEVIKVKSTLEQEIDALKKKLALKDNQILELQRNFSEKQVDSSKKFSELESRLGKAKLSNEMLEKENRIITISLQQSQSESERLRELNTGLKQSLSNLMKDLQNQGSRPLSPYMLNRNFDNIGLVDKAMNDTEMKLPENDNSIENRTDSQVTYNNSSSTVDELEFNDRLRTLDFDIQRLQNSLRAKRLKS